MISQSRKDLTRIRLGLKSQRLVLDLEEVDVRTEAQFVRDTTYKGAAIPNKTENVSGSLCNGSIRKFQGEPPSSSIEFHGQNDCQVQSQ